MKNWPTVGRFLTGMGLGMTLTIPNVYIVEVTDPQFRGVLGVLPNLFCQLGIFITYVIGQWFDWSQLAYFCMFPSLFQYTGCDQCIYIYISISDHFPNIFEIFERTSSKYVVCCMVRVHSDCQNFQNF